MTRVLHDLFVVTKVIKHFSLLLCTCVHSIKRLNTTGRINRYVLKCLPAARVMKLTLACCAVEKK